MRRMSTNTDTLPATVDLPYILGADFTWDDTVDPSAVLSEADAAEFTRGCVIPAPYADPRMADLERFAVVIPAPTEDGYVVLGRVVQSGDAWEAFDAGASHLFGRFDSVAVAAAYVCLSVEH